MSEAERILKLTPGEVLGPTELPPAISPELIADLKRDEGCRLAAYPDPLTRAAPWTIGYGHTGPEVHRGLIWTQEQCDAALQADIAHACALLDEHLPWWRTLTEARRACMVNLCYNMGIGDNAHGLLSFHNTLGCIKRGDYERAAVGMRTSKWAFQVGARAVRLATMMRLGHRP